MKFYKIWVVLACLGLVIGSILPLAYYPDLDKNFTGFFSEGNHYGKPGVVFVFFAVVFGLFAFVGKLWSARANIFIGAVNLAYFIKTYVLFTQCYMGTCPEKMVGIYVLMGASILLIIIALFPDIGLPSPSEKNNSFSESAKKD